LNHSIQKETKSKLSLTIKKNEEVIKGKSVLLGWIYKKMIIENILKEKDNLIRMLMR
jgi:hypothetical protein